MKLADIRSPEDIKNLSSKEIVSLAKEIRETIISVVEKNGGHLASNLGVVELTLALHKTFSSPKDAIIWDVSHQCYAHKLLTGRYNQFDTLRTGGGLSGFTNVNESEHDYFINGHASTSISSALGLLAARELKGDSGKVIAVIGDGALTGGMAYEALSHAGQLCKNLIVILNDNQMSIDRNTGSVSRYLSRLTMTSRYQTFRSKVDKLINKIPYFNRHIEKFIFRFKRSIKGFLLTNNLFVDLGFEYVGPLDGHNISVMEREFKKVSKLHRPVVVHVVTKKGKGYEPAESKPENYHGVSPKSDKKSSLPSFTEAFGNAIVELGKKNEKITAITAAMTSGTGLSAFAKEFPDRFFDVGICEEHAVTFAAGLSKGGLIPFVCIYSTFLQRAIDQIIHDISLQKLHCVFCIDRSGPVPNDGATHQGIFDISLLRPVPYLQILSPSTEKDLKLCLEYASNQTDAVAIRWPKNHTAPEMEEFSVAWEKGKGILVKASENKDVLLVTTGGMFDDVKRACDLSKENGRPCDIFVLRFIKPLDEDAFIDLCQKYKKIVFVEDGVKTGGISEYLLTLLLKNGILNADILAFEEKYYSHGTREDVLTEANLNVTSILNHINKE